MSVDHDRPAKRQRVTQACQRCRSRKLRCDGGSLSCGACLTAEATCSYDGVPGRQRGLKSGYVKVLESLWGSVFQNVPGSERVVSQLLADLPANAESITDGAGGDEASPLERWRASAIPEAIRALLDGRPLPAVEAPGVANLTWGLPSASGADNVEQHNLRVDALPPASSLDGIERRDFDSPNLPSPPTHAANKSSSLVSGLPDLPQDWQTLVQAYLCTEYCCLPIFEKTCPYRWAYKYQDLANINLCALESSCRGQYASLWAILVLGELHLNGAKSARLDQMKLSAKIMLATAESEGPDRTFSHAFLLWALVYTGSCEFTLARMMLAQAMVLADLRESTDPQAQGGEALVQAGCYVVETILALAAGGQMSTITVDTDTFLTGDVGEWDPFINVLRQEQGAAASTMLPQLPPSRTGSTFQAFVKLMTILRKTSNTYSDPQTLTAELQAWEASLEVDICGAVTLEVTQARVPVPSQLNLRLWHGTMYGIIARLRQGASGSASDGVSGSLALHGMGALHVAGREYGLSMLPATSSILSLLVSQLPDAIISPPDAVPGAYSNLATKFLNHWGCMNTNSGVQQSITRTAAQGSHIKTHHPSVLPRPTEGLTIETAGPERQESAPRYSQYTSDTPAGPMMQSGIQANGDADGTPTISHRRPTSHVPAPCVDSSAVTNVGTYLEDPASYDLLEYLTMFENSNSHDRQYMEPLGFVSGLQCPTT